MDDQREITKDLRGGGKVVVRGSDIYASKRHPVYRNHGVVMELGPVEWIGRIGHRADGLRVVIYCHEYQRAFATDDHASAQDYVLELMS